MKMLVSVGQIVSDWDYGTSDGTPALVTAVTAVGEGSCVAACGTDLAVRLFDLRHGLGVPHCRAGTFSIQNAIGHIPFASADVSLCFTCPNIYSVPDLIESAVISRFGHWRWWRFGQHMERWMAATGTQTPKRSICSYICVAGWWDGSMAVIDRVSTN